jgi:hypothetical protein
MALEAETDTLLTLDFGNCLGKPTTSEQAHKPPARQGDR